MHYKSCMSVRNNWDKYGTFCKKKNAESVIFYLVLSVLLEYIWKVINGSDRWTKRLSICENLWWLLQRKKVY